MFEKIKSRIGFRLFVILAFIIILSVGPFTFITLKAINKYGLEAAEVNELKIRSQAFFYLEEITRERAHGYQAFFDRITASVGMLNRQASTIYSDLAYYSERPLENYQFHIHPKNGFWANSIEDPVVSLYWGAPELSPDIKRELLALTHITPFFTQSLIENPEALASYVITVSGIGQYYTDVRESKAAVFNLPPTSEFDLRDGEPMTIFTKSKDSSREVRWTNIYKDDVIDGLMLTASGPIYDNKGVFRGITGIDVPLKTVINDILQPSDSRWGEGGILFSFLLNQNNKVIALPEPYYPFLGLTVGSSELLNSSDRLDVDLADSSKKDVRELAHNLERKDGSSFKIYHADESYLVVTQKMEKLGWVLGVVVQEDYLLSSILDSRIALQNTIKTIKINGIILSLLTVFAAIIAVFIAIQYLVLPLRILIDSTKRVARGDLSTRCPVTTTDEVGSLAVSFNTMVAQLQKVQEEQQSYSKSLKTEAEQRAAQLSLKKDELNLQDKQLQKSLDERELLLKEIYHRTKNNMLVIISLLDLQTQDMEDDCARIIFLETESRIRAMALVHEKLYRSKNLSEIDLGEYLYEVAEELLKSMVVGKKIKLMASTIDPVPMTIDYAVPLGLVINEIVTNSIKYAFPGDRPGTIHFDLNKSREGEIVLTIGDDGIGLAEDIDVHNTSSFGMRIIISSLVKLQLKGTVSIDREHGTSYRISFFEPKTKRRI